jgi:GDP-mannose 6-dehydrogenase
MGIKMIADKGRRKIGILWFSFKAGTDDLRESPLIDVIEQLIGEGYEPRLYDRHVNLAALTGANKDYILNHIPHIARLMVESMEHVLSFAETVVIGNDAPEFREIPTRIGRHQTSIDLIRVVGKTSGERYDGICG